MVVVRADEVVPRASLVLRVPLRVARVLQFAAPVREPVADLDVGQSRGVCQVLLLRARGVRVLLALHQPLLQAPLDLGRKQLLRVPTAATGGPGASAVRFKRGLSDGNKNGHGERYLFIRLLRTGRIVAALSGSIVEIWVENGRENMKINEGERKVEQERISLSSSLRKMATRNFHRPAKISCLLTYPRFINSDG